MSRPVVGITVGDPAGIGPEIIDKALRSRRLKDCGVDWHIIGELTPMHTGKLSKASAQIAYSSLLESATLLRSGAIQGVVNAPVHKANLTKVGFKFPGQTEFYANAFGKKPGEVTMMLYGPKFSVSLVTTHCSLNKVPKLLSQQGIIDTTVRTAEVFLQKGVKSPKIAICGLNPHAGESGLFGKEEIEIIEPAIKSLKRKRSLMKQVTINGPHPPDAVFRSAYQGEYHAVICMYHDQGLIPFKMISFDDGVNITLGLPIWRAAPDHGTACDIAGTGKASPASLISALRQVASLVQ